MYDYRDDEIDELQRKLEGKPRKKEVVLSSRALLTRDEFTRRSTRVLKKELRKLRRSDGS